MKHDQEMAIREALVLLTEHLEKMRREFDESSEVDALRLRALLYDLVVGKRAMNDVLGMVADDIQLVEDRK